MQTLLAPGRHVQRLLFTGALTAVRSRTGVAITHENCCDNEAASFSGAERRHEKCSAVFSNRVSSRHIHGKRGTCIFTSMRAHLAEFSPVNCLVAQELDVASLSTGRIFLRMCTTGMNQLAQFASFGLRSVTILVRGMQRASTW